MIKGYTKSIRRQKQIIRQFNNMGPILVANGMDITSRHNLFVACVQEAKEKLKQIDKQGLSGEKASMKRVNVVAQKLFIDSVLEEYPEWFEGVKL